jgi:hypothetical protein
MHTDVISRHVFRRTARAQERSLEHRRQVSQENARILNQTDLFERLSRTSYRVARRRGGFRWVVEMVTR